MSEAARELSGRRCFNHSQREAAAVCLQCGRYYCRECVTEHEGRVLCASCLRAAAAQGGGRRLIMAPVLRLMQTSLGVFMAWLFFYLAAKTLLSIPDSFHDGTLWEKAGDIFR